MLHALGNSFDDLSPEDANAVNTEALAGSQAASLSINAGLWLSGDQILNLIQIDNPDGLGTRADWISGPAPLNYFYTFFAQTLASPAHHGRVHIMVVNTSPDTGVESAAIGGVHWFVMAWIIDPYVSGGAEGGGAEGRD